MWLSFFIFVSSVVTVWQVVKRWRKSKPALPPQVVRLSFQKLQPGGETPIFHGLRVVELATVVAGPTCGNLFAAMGAEVVKVEELGGDKFRNQFLAYEKTGGRKVATMFEGVNFNKASIVLDLKDRLEFQKFLELLSGADVFITNIRIESLARLGLDYESVHTQLPGLIYSHVTAWGRSGPDVGLPGYDVGAFWASTSFAAKLMPEGRHMLYPGGFGDCQTGEDLFASTCAALMHRMEGGGGQLADSSLQRFGMWCASPWLTQEATKTAPEPFLEHTWEDSIPAYQACQSTSALQATYTTADDVHFTLLVQEPDSLAALAAVTVILDIPLTAARRATASGLIEQLATGFRGQEWMMVSRRMKADGVEHTRILSPEELMKDVLPPEVADSGIFVSIPGVDDSRGFVNMPFECQSSPAHGYNRRAPMAGVHTSAYLKHGWSERAVEASLPPVVRESKGGPLRGITVLEFSVGPAVAVSAACLRLASLGARVIQLRAENAPTLKASAQINRGKEVVSLQWPAESARVRNMIGTVDVFVTNAMVSQLAAVGLDDETMRALHPRLLYVLLTPWGRAGPERPRGERGAFFAGSGMGQYLGGALPAPPVTLPDRAGDMMVATSVFAGAMAGLFHQRRTGEGQLVDIAEVRHAAFCMASMYGVFYKDPEKLKMFLIPPKDLALNHPLATYNAYMTKDGVWVQLLGLDIGRHLPKYLRVFGIQCKTYSRVLTALVLEVVPNYKEKNILLRAGPVFRVLNSALKEAFGCMTWKQAKLYCDKHDVWYSKVATPATALKNRQAHAGDTFLHTSDGLLVNCPTFLSSCGTDFDGFNNTQT